MAARKKSVAKKSVSRKSPSKKASPGKAAAAKKKTAQPKTKKTVARSVAKKSGVKSAPKKQTPKIQTPKKLVSSGAPAAPYPAVGAAAPAFTAVSDQGGSISLSDFTGKPVILYFYPKDDTPGCTVEACDFRDHTASLREKGAVVLGVSRDSIESHRKFRDKYSLKFPLLADVSGAICEAYGVWQEKNNYGKKYMGIVRTTFLIGRDGRIAKVYPKVRVEGHVAEILKDLEAI